MNTRKNFFIILFLILVLATPARAAWDVTEPAGDSNASDIDANVIANFTALGGALRDYRAGMKVRWVSTTTMKVSPGVLWVNDYITKTTDTTLDITGAPGDWAEATGQQAVSTLGYVVCDTSGNLQLTVTAPTHSDYGVTVATGTKRYATVNSVVYRYIGWFYMNATGSGELEADGVSNTADMSVTNTVYKETSAYSTVAVTTPASDSSTPIYSEGTALISVRFRPTDANNSILVEINGGVSGGGSATVIFYFQDGTGSDEALGVSSVVAANNAVKNPAIVDVIKAGGITIQLFEVRAGSDSGNIYLHGMSSGARLGLSTSIRLTEIENQID